MKKNLFLIIALFVATSMSAQFYVGAKVGYGFGTQKTAAGTTATDKTNANNWVSLGQGFTPGLKLGYFFNENLGFELGMNYLLGSKVTVNDYKLTGVTALVEAQTTQFRLMPTLVYKSDMGIYGRFGLVIPVTGKTVITASQSIDFMGTPINVEQEQEFKGKFSLGFVGAFGYSFELNDNMQLFGELEYVALTIRGKTSEITKLTQNGVDGVANADVYDLKTNFVDQLDESSNNSDYNDNHDKAKPMDELGSSTGYSSFRINFGITMTF